jgi:preprotein translocase subunit SecE
MAGKQTMARAAALTTEEQRAPRENAITRGREFLTNVRAEMRKVTTPSRAEVQSTTLVVIGAVFAFAAFFYVVDSILNYVLSAVLHWLGGGAAIR